MKTNLEKFAGETGADVKSILDNAEKLHKKMQRMTADNERSLLGKADLHLSFCGLKNCCECRLRKI